MGIDNPLTIAVSSYAPEQVQISIDNGTFTGEKGEYIWNPVTPGKAQIMVTLTENDGNTRTLETINFRVKRVPDPIAKLGKIYQQTAIKAATFMAQSGIVAALDNFDFDAKCTVTGFTMTLVPLRADPIEVINKGGRFSAAARRLVNRVKAGDTVYFDNIKCKCPGDTAPRKLNSLVFKIK